MCTSIYSGAFGGCNFESITSQNFPKCTYIGSWAFVRCARLREVEFSLVSTIYSQAFSSVSSITKINFPEGKTVHNGAFYDCFCLAEANLPKCTTVSDYAFTRCALSTIDLPACTTIKGNAFADNSSLTHVSLPVCSTIGSYAFFGCISLVSMYLGASSVCTLSHSNAFGRNGAGTFTASIFVPASLIDAYKKATNWTYFSKRFVAIEDIDGGGE